MLVRQGTLYLMGTIIQIWLMHDNADQLLIEVEMQLKDYERRFSANDRNSHLMQINHNAGIKPVFVESDLFELIKLGKTHSLVKGGFLNIAIGPLIQAWRIGFVDAKCPSELEITALLNKIDPNNIILNEAEQTVFLKYNGMAIDLGALAKGYFADKIMAFLKHQQVKSAYIDLGGNVLTLGQSPHQPDGYWRVGIQNPVLPRGHCAMVIKVKNQSVVTSGSYERTLTINNKTYHHIFDSQTGYPIASDVASITIVSEKSIDGEIWTTQLYGKTAIEIIHYLNKLPNIEAVLINNKQEIAQTDGILVDYYE